MGEWADYWHRKRSGVTEAWACNAHCACGWTGPLRRDASVADTDLLRHQEDDRRDGLTQSHPTCSEHGEWCSDACPEPVYFPLGQHRLQPDPAQKPS